MPGVNGLEAARVIGARAFTYLFKQM